MAIKQIKYRGTDNMSEIGRTIKPTIFKAGPYFGVIKRVAYECMINCGNEMINTGIPHPKIIKILIIK
jgi:hypothetical protein